ncbi:hypothetical protein ACQKEY_22495 [Lysinibacillus fusiformis]|uniref:hypothetical protein n=1 Tax=Lysinibacillus fusiformis TaxID=28031 RepID=UPI003CFEC4C1
MGKAMSKSELIIESLSKVQCSKNEDECLDHMTEMLWKIAKGTRYQSDVEVAFDVLQGFRDRKANGKRY